MSMGNSRLGLAGIALSLLVITKPEPAAAGSAAALAALHADASVSPVLALPVAFHHHARRVQSFYCYPRNYWWFYRPYTTALDNHARCMPYFHYPSYDGQGRPERYIK
jgi:hypothetical protein